MALAHSPRIVTDGLVLCLDAGNTKSYPGPPSPAAYVWYDLSGNGNNATLNSVGRGSAPFYSSSFGGMFVITEQEGYIDLPNNSFSFADADSFSIECWVWADTLSGIDAIYYSQSSNATGFYGVGHNSNGDGFYIGDYNGQSRTTAVFGSNASANTWNHVVFLRNTSNEYVVYQNTIPSTASSASYLSLTSTDPRIGINPVYYPEAWDGYISNFKIYNRALTASEIQQNFNALRGRFGI